jgi:predicted TIM-barrel fold metal-dependent hydrolase
MLVDINAYVGHWPFKKMRFNTCEKMLQRMDRFGVDISVISNLNGIFYKNTQPANLELYKEIKSEKRFAERFIPFAVINPIYAGWQDDFEICVEKLGMKGIRLYPKYHDYELTDPGCIELVKMTSDRGLPVAFSFRMVDARQRSWMDIKNEWDLKDIIAILKEVPDAKYLLLNHCNDSKLSEDEEAVLKEVNVLIDTSGRSINTLPELLEKYGTEKFAFGTHSPILDYLTGLLRIDSLREEEADEGMKEMLRSGNAIKILGL